MPEAWISKRIGELGRVVTGKTPSTKIPENFDGPYPFITIPDLDGRVYITETSRTLSEKGALAIQGAQLPAGAVMISCIATVGRCGITSKPSFTNQQINSVIPNKTVDARFLYYAFTQLGKELERAGGGGSVYTNVSKSRFSNILVRIPNSLSEQREIAAILGVLDDKIELNRQMGENLLEITRTAFKAWFVEFSAGPAKGQGLRELSNGRVLPESWDLMPLANFADVVYGAPFASKEFNPPGVGRPLIRIRDLRSMECSAWTTEVHRNGHLIHPGDIVVGMDGEFRSYIWLGSPAWLNQRVCHFEPLPGVPRGYVFCALEPELDFLERSKTGTTVIHLGKRDIDSLHFVWPGAAVLRDFGDLVEPILDRMVVAATEAKTLKSIRDALLPKLISGKLRVPEAEQLVSEVA